MLLWQKALIITYPVIEQFLDESIQAAMQRFEGRKVKEDPDITISRSIPSLEYPIQYRTERIGLVGGFPMGEHAHSLRVQNQTEFLMCHKVT